MVLSPLQMMVLPVMLTVGAELTLTMIESLAGMEQTLSETVTEYDVVLVGLTVIEAVVSPVLQVFPKGKLEVSTRAVSPTHSVVEPLGVMIGVTCTKLVIFTLSDVVQAPPKLAVTFFIPVSETMMD